MAEMAVEEDQGLGWGKSLPVPSVQEMVRRDPLSVPQRYLRDLREEPGEEALAASLEIPVIDFSLLSSAHECERKRLDAACKDWGFFQIINHGIDKEVLDNIVAAMSGFFELAADEKKRYSMAANDVQGYGQAFVVSEEQRLDWSDMMFLMTLPTKLRRFKHWPTIIPGFKDAVERYSEEMDRVGKELLANLSPLVGMEKDGLLGLHGKMKQGMRLNYYPPCCRPDQVLGISPHSDASSITLLLQDGDLAALQIKHKGMWIPVKPIPDALVVNVGDSLEAWSNGMYRSIEHRATTNEKTARMSLATFLFPDDDVEIGPVDQMVDDEHRPRMYRRVKYVDYLRQFLGRRLDGKAHTHALKLEN